ncbi:MAG: PAS domain S-box protein, partial [Proteobacteria bacterium]
MSEENSIDLVRDFLQKIVDHLPISLFCKDARHNFQYVLWNETASKMWGLKLLDVVGRDDFEIFPHDIATAFRAKDKETMAGREVVYIPQEFVPNGPDLMTARTWKIPIYGEDGGPQWLLGIAQDISEPRLVET